MNTTNSQTHFVPASCEFERMTTMQTLTENNFDPNLCFLDAHCGLDQEVQVHILDVTPAMALSWLTRNKTNRAPVKASITKVTWALRNGAWDFTHQGIAFNKRGELVDGQNRLTAIAKTGITARMMVTFSLPGDYGLTIDSGTSRSAADILLRSKRSTAVCSALALLTEGATVVATPQNRKLYNANKEAVDWALKTIPMQRGLVAPITAAFAYAYPAAPTEVEEFAMQLVNHTAPDVRAPAVALRRYIDREQGDSHLRTMHVVLRALKSHVQRLPLSRIPIDTKGFRFFRELRLSMGA